MHKIRYIAWAAVFLAAGVFAWVSLNKTGVQDNSLKLGSNFNLVRMDGTAIKGEELAGRPHLIFFGFTNCPEICPTALYDTTTWMEKLGKRADNMDVYFITVDPERDTQEFLSEYLSSFDERIIGLTGSLEEIDKAAKGYHVYYRKVPLEDGDYTVDHTSSIFMMKADGSFMGTIAYQENEDVVLKKLDRLLKG